MHKLDKPRRAAWVFPCVLYALYASGITAIAVAEGDLWLALPILLAIPPLAFIVRDRVWLRRWPHLGPWYLRRSEVTSVGRWRGHQVAQTGRGWQYVDTQQLVSENPERALNVG